MPENGTHATIAEGTVRVVEVLPDGRRITMNSVALIDDQTSFPDQ